MYSYSKLTSKYSITLLECRPNGPEYIMCPPVFRRISCKREKRHELNNSSRLHNKKNIAYTTLFFVFTFWIVGWNEPHKFILWLHHNRVHYFLHCIQNPNSLGCFYISLVVMHVLLKSTALPEATE